MSRFAGWVLSKHAEEELARRDLPLAVIKSVLESPSEILPVRAGRVVAQALVQHGPLKAEYLVRVFVDIDRSPPVVVTAYRTSKLRKYRDRP